MKRKLQSRLLRTTILGLIVAAPTYALAGEAQYYFPKDDAGKSSEKSKTSETSAATKIDKSKVDKTSKIDATNGSVAPNQNNKQTGSAGFRPDFDGAGGRGPAMAPVEGKKTLMTKDIT